MENKYYTPEISEFHVGFEYERLWLHVEPPMWGKETFYLNDSHIKLMQYSLGDIEPLARVKYLDQSDIESLGWKLYSQELTNRSNWCCFRNTQLELYVQLDNNYFPRLLNFKSRGGDHTGNFKIKIKNKSELIKLQQQLNIK